MTVGLHNLSKCGHSKCVGWVELQNICLGLCGGGYMLGGYVAGKALRYENVGL